MRAKRGMAGCAAAAAMLACAPSAGAVTHRFETGAGTVCSIEVGARASDSLGALSGVLPQVGYSSTPACSYARRTPAARSPNKRCRRAGAKKKGKQRKRAKRRCARKNRGRTAAARSSAVETRAIGGPALLGAARLVLLAPSGVVSSSEATTAAAGLGGYSCALQAGAACADSGRLMPAAPRTPYVAELSVELAPPPGEAWVSVPARCSAGPVPSCELRSQTVSPRL